MFGIPGMQDHDATGWRRSKSAAQDEKTDVKCEKCGGETVIKTGPYGKYYQCLDDKCKARKSIVISSGVKMPEVHG